jgi:hypothetical protein
MRKTILLAGAVLAAAALTALPAAGEVLFTGDGVFGPTIATLGVVEIPGDSFSFSFELPAVIAGNPTTQVTNSHYFVDGTEVTTDALASVLFYPAGIGGGFDLNFAGGETVSLYTSDASGFADIGSTLTIAPGHYTFVLDGSSFAGQGDLTVASVPEPAAWALMIGGFGLAGATLRRGRASVA